MGKGEAILVLLFSKRKIALSESGEIAVIIKHKTLSWNVRDLNDRDKCLRISNLLRLWKMDIVCFQETKMVSILNCFVQSLWGCPYVDWCHVDSRGASGGILLMWDQRVVSRIDSCLGRFVVACHFRNVEDGLEWAFARVYGSNRDHIRQRLWEELARLISLWEVPWCIGGDFNVTKSPFFLMRDQEVLLIGMRWLNLRILLQSRSYGFAHGWRVIYLVQQFVVV